MEKIPIDLTCSDSKCELELPMESSQWLQDTLGNCDEKERKSGGHDKEYFYLRNNGNSKCLTASLNNSHVEMQGCSQDKMQVWAYYNITGLLVNQHTGKCPGRTMGARFTCGNASH